MPRLLVANVHFAPNSFGGATIVAENVAQLLSEQYDWTTLVVTTFDDPGAPAYSLRRYCVGEVNVVAINVPRDQLSYEEKYNNPQFEKAFQVVLDTFKPTLAHVHCVQNMGASFMGQIRKSGVPLAVTIHDCWWICDRQFMINSKGSYCYQTKIDLDVCRYCVSDFDNAKRRLEYLEEQLAAADVFLFPSEFHRQLFVANGLPPEKCAVNKNGVKPPNPGYRKSEADDPEVRVRFGFVGGPGPIKGAPLILKAFRDLQRSDYELVVVDALQNLGGSWQDRANWDIPGKLRFHPAYTSATMDEFFKGIDVLLFPSQWKESFGLTVREALLRDIWVIATDAGGVPEDCEDGVNSTVVPMTSDHTPLRDAIAKCFTSPDWAVYVNPSKGRISTYDTQASDLNTTFEKMMTDTTPATRPERKIRIDNLFLSVGAMKAGTTWLYSVLRDHPDIYFSPEKEVHYFAHLHTASEPLTPQGRLSRVKALTSQIDPQKSQLGNTRSRMIWFSKYLSDPIDDAWYADLFSLRGGQKYCADFSNLHCHLDEEGWEHVRGIASNLKVLYTMRNPMKRLWSHVKFHLKVTGQTDKLKTWKSDELVKFARQEFIWTNTKYVEAIDRMQRYLEPDQLMISFFEDIHDDPRGWLSQLQEFLGIDAVAFDEATLRKKVNPTETLAMPEALVEAFTGEFAQQAQVLSERGFTVPASWAEVAQVA